jgi:hypothetical protein
MGRGVRKNHQWPGSRVALKTAAADFLIVAYAGQCCRFERHYRLFGN